MIWTQWSDLKIPGGLSHLPTNGVTPDPADLEKITFYVPAYMNGSAALTPIASMSSLQVIQSPNAGVDDVIPLLPKGVKLCNAAGVHDASTAELAVGLAIASRRGFNSFAQNQSKGVWLHTSNASLTDSKVAILGHGNIGKTIAQMLGSFEVEVASFSRSGSDGALTMENFDRLLPTFDVIILIVPLNDQTRHFINAQRLSAMKDGASLINVARGAIIDTDALVSELSTGRISCALDVTDPEPLPAGHPLWSAPNTIITPHVGGDSKAFEPRGRALVEEQLARFAAGQPLINVVRQG
ncbi:dihydrofolate reductase [Actinobacteria bacterium IMCC26103]|nr:dihydrofolate reductase [Actinobacteria bacterium IMCC26103]